MSRRLHQPHTPYLFLAPAMIVLLVFSLVAMIQVIYYSFTRYTAFSGPDFVGWENYRRAFASQQFWFTLQNSFLYLIVTPVIMVLSLIAAMTVHSGIKGGRILRVLLFLPVVTPTIVASLSFRLLFNEDEGLLNSLLTSIHLPTVHWLTSYPATLITAMIVTLWKGFGYYMMIFLAGLMSVPLELEEAASIDGAGRFRVFWHVVLPWLRPLLVLVATISSISAMKVFDELYITIQGAPISHQTVVPLIYKVAFEDGDYGFASAIGVVLFVIILVFSVINLKTTRNV